MAEAVTVEEIRQFQWFVIRCWTGKEEIVERCLKRAGFGVYNPLKRAYRFKNGALKRKGRKSPVNLPIFSGYVFIGFSDYTPTWWRLFEFILVKGVIGRGGAPQAVDPWAMFRLINRHSNGAFDAPVHHRNMTTHREFDVGDTVITDDGLVEGKVIEIVNEVEAVIEIAIFGSEHRIRSQVRRLWKAA